MIALTLLLQEITVHKWFCCTFISMTYVKSLLFWWVGGSHWNFNIFLWSILLFISLAGTFHYFLILIFIFYVLLLLIRSIHLSYNTTTIFLPSFPPFPMPSSLLGPLYSLSVSVQKGTGLSWVSTQHGITSWNRNKLLPL